MKWTDEQLLAINSFAKPIIVSAAAGSGKTAVLVERTISLLRDKEKAIPADRVLAVTFTNDAASQMKRKLSEAFEKASSEDPDNEWLILQQSLLKLSDITTINAFCFGLMKDNIQSTDFQNGVRILEETEANMMTERALTRVLEEEYAVSPERMEWLIDLLCHENDSQLRGLILHLNRFLRSLPFSDYWVRSNLEKIRSGQQAKLAKAEFIKLAKDISKLIENDRERILDLCDALEYHSSAKACLLENCELSEHLNEKICSSDWDSICEFLAGFKFGGIKNTRKKIEKENCSEEENAFYALAKATYDTMNSRLSELKKIFIYTQKDIEEQTKTVSDVFEALCDITLKLQKEVYSAKVEKNAVDFSDTEKIAVDLLLKCDENGSVERTELCREIIESERYKLIIIDEFQDVNNLQDTIFKAISNTDDLKKIGSNLFCVGDVKQAIYRFRLSNPNVFMQTQNDALSKDNDVTLRRLTKNFRSRKNIIDFTNYVFSSLMCEELGETNYTKDEALALGAEYIGKNPETKIITTHSLSENEDVVPSEFVCIAREIKKMIDQKTPVKDGDTYRPCRPSDFCVLTKTNVSDPSLAESFEDVGLKVLSSDKAGYLKSREISVLLNLLSVINSPMRDLPMASVMLSPIMGFSDDDLATIRLYDKKSKLYKNILSISNGELEATDALKAKCKACVSLIKKLRVYSCELSLTRLIKKVYDETDMFSIASQYEDGDKKCANLYLLLEYANSFERSSDGGIASFLRYIDYISSTGGDFEEAYTVTESDDCVNVKTIHKSKGLEYPFVFLCQLGKTFNKSDLQDKLLLNFDHGFGLILNDYKSLSRKKTLYSEYIAFKNESELLSEQLRLLYVALTRAKEKLVIVLNEADKIAQKFAPMITDEKVAPIVSKSAKCFADWLVMALLKHPCFENLREELSLETFVEKKQPPKNSFEYEVGVEYKELPEIKVQDFSYADYSSENEEEKPQALPDNEMIKRLVSGYNREYDKRLVDNEAKVTVSELVGDDPVNFFPRVTRLEEALSELSATEKGVVTHRFMECADYSLASKGLDLEIKRLKSLGIFTDKEADSINKTAISKFFESEIYSRLSKSDNVMREKQFIVRFCDIAVDEALKEIYNDTEGMLQGIADCVFEEGDGYVLIDYKTDRVKTPEELYLRYSKQLELYKAAFEAILDKPVKSAYIYSFVLEKGIEIDL